MKKQILPLLLSLFLFHCMLIDVKATPVAPVRTCEPSFLGGWQSIILDGERDEWYGNLQTTSIFNPTGWDGDADFMANFYLCFSLEYLYVLVEVTDDVKHNYHWGIGNPWEFDNVEIFLQMDTNTVTTTYSPTTVQLRICRGLDSVETPGHASRADFGYYMEEDAPGGWIAEVAIPWSAVMAEGTDPEDASLDPCYPVGFDLSGADSDNSDGDPDVGNRDVQSAWDEDDPADAEDRTEDLAWNNTSVFGYLHFYMLCPDNIAPDKSDALLRLAPNPGNEHLRIEDLDQIGRLNIYNMQGVKVLDTEYQPGQELDISGLKSGMYILHIDGVKHARFIKQ